MGVLWGMIRDKMRQEGYEAGYRQGLIRGTRDGYVQGQTELIEFMEGQHAHEDEAPNQEDE